MTTSITPALPAFFSAVLLVTALVVSTLQPTGSLAALLLLAAAAYHLTHRQFRAEPLGWLMAAWAIWVPASLAFSLAPGFALHQVAALSSLPLAWWSARELAIRGSLEKLLAPTSLILFAALALWGVLQGPATFTGKPQGPFNDPNLYAALLNLLALPALARYLANDLEAQRCAGRTSLLVCLGVWMLLMVMVASRGATLAAILMTAGLLWAGRSQPRIGRKVALLGAVFLTSWCAAQWPLSQHTQSQDIAVRLVDTFHQGDTARLQLIASTWAMIRQEPFFGSGLGSFRLLYPIYRDTSEAGTAGGWAHNDYLQLWQEAGVPMLVLLVGLFGWVLWFGWRLRRSGERGLADLGYAAAMGAVLMHALVNFLLYFPLVTILLGVYAARLHPSAQLGANHQRPMRLAVAGYVLIVGLLISGQVLMENLLYRGNPAERAIHALSRVYPTYQVAYWLSVVSPFHPTPQQTMGQQLGQLAAEGSGAILDAALDRMDAAWKRAPCYLPYNNEAMRILWLSGHLAGREERGLAMARRSVACNPRHGLSYFYAGRFTPQDDEAMETWQQGMARTVYAVEKVLLLGAIIERQGVEEPIALAELSRRMALAIEHLESHPGAKADPVFWTEAVASLVRIQVNSKVNRVRHD